MSTEIVTFTLRRSTLVRAATGGVLLLAAAFLGRPLLHRAPTPPAAVTSPAPVLTVTTEPVRFRTVHRTLDVTGGVYAQDELSIGTEAPGLRIVSVQVEEGDRVHRGQLLAQLDASVLQAQLEQDVARLHGSRASVSKAAQPNRPQDIDALRFALQAGEATVQQQQANLAQAEAAERNDRLNASRYQTLLAQGFVTVADADNARTQALRDEAATAAARQQVLAARAAVAEAQSHLQMAELGGRVEDVQIASASAAEIEGQIHQLQAQIAQTRILAPDDGWIVQRDAHLGDISGSKPMFTMVRKNQLELRAQVPEAALTALHPGQTVRVAGYGHTVEGRIWLVSSQVDPTTRLGAARVLLPVGKGFLPGMFLDGTVDEGARRALTVPMACVQGSASKHYVLVYGDGRAHRRDVTLGPQSGTDVEVSGLSEGEPVIVEGAAFVNDGDVVAVAPHRAHRTADAHPVPGS